jgi:hypothetical protein
MAEADSRAWILQTDPKSWDISKFARDVDTGNRSSLVNWPVDEAGEGIAAGDRLFLWSGGDDRVAGVLALARAVSGPEVLPDDGHNYRRSKAAVPEPDQLRVTIDVDLVLPRPLFRVKLEWDKELDAGSFLPGEEGIAFPLSREQADALEQRSLAVTARPRAGRGAR